MKTNAACLIALVATACLPQERLNSKCQWTNDTTRVLDLTNNKDRGHLELDAHLAEDLGIRYGDSFRSAEGLESAGSHRHQCTEALIATVMRIHSVDRARVEAASRVRDVRVDIALVAVPMIAAFLVVAVLITRRVARAFDPEDLLPLVLTLLLMIPVTATFGVMAGEEWEWLVEWARLRNAHLSDREFGMLITRNAFSAWIVGMVLFAAVAITELRKRRRSVV